MDANKSFAIVFSVGLGGFFLAICVGIYSDSLKEQERERARIEAFKAGLVEKQTETGRIIFVKPEDKK